MGSVIQTEKLSVRVGENTVLHDVDVQVSQGELVALLGGNGAGKTTLLRSILGLTERVGGTVEVFGTPIEKLSDWRRIGYVPQRSQLQVAKATVDELVASGVLSRRRWFHPLTAGNRAAIDAALDIVRMTSLRRREVSELSGGQRQRAVIARALAGTPELLLLDEPMAGLDIDTQDGLASVFEALKQRGLTVVVVLHELGAMEPLIDRSIVLRQGQKIYDGPLRSGPGGDHGHDAEPDDASILAWDTLHGEVSR
jgi:zinc transport system ATP-binding protein